MDAPHESPTEGNKPKAERKGFWRSTFDWRMSPAELAEQVSGYSSLGIGKSYRKLSAMLWLLTVAITALIGPWLMKMDWIAVISNTVIYSGLAIPCFRGHRWAFVLSMALWTIEKGYFLLESVASQARLRWGSVGYVCHLVGHLHGCLLEGADRGKGATTRPTLNGSH